MARCIISLLLAFLAFLGIARADVVTGGHVEVDFSGRIRPRTLPRDHVQPISVGVQGKVTPVGGSRPAALRRFAVAFNRNARLSTRGLPVCPARRLLADTTRQALEACRGALVGSGHFSAHIDIPEQAPFPSNGRALVFNSSLGGHPAFAVHIFGTNPVPTTEVLPLAIGHSTRPGLDVTLSATMPEVGDQWGYVTGFEFTLNRRYTYRGRERSLVSASCPAPAGFSRVPFRLATGSFYLGDGSVHQRSLGAVCHVRESGA